MKFYFAWIQEGEAFNPQVHTREDEKIFSLSISQKESEYAIAQIKIQNPYMGLLSPLRGHHALICWENQGSIELLFRGRVVGIPAVIEEKCVIVELSSEPSSNQSFLLDLHKTLQKSPWWDPLFVNEEDRDDPVESLEARSSLYEWSRTEGTVKVSDIFWGSHHQQVMNFFPNSLKITAIQQPLSQVEVSINAEWVQRYESVTDISPLIEQAFSLGKINTFTGLSFKDKWWQQGESMGESGYKIESSVLEELTPSSTGVLDLYPVSSPTLWTVNPELPHQNPYQVHFKRYWFKAHLALRWKLLQHRREKVKFILKNNVQPLMASGGSKKLKFHLQNVAYKRQACPWTAKQFYTSGFSVEYKGEIYLCLVGHRAAASFSLDERYWQRTESAALVSGQELRPSFFLYKRGRAAIAHAIESARAHLAMSCRCIEITFRGALEDLSFVTTDHSLRIEDPRIPGGKASGKIKKYTIYVEGDSGDPWVEVTLGCAIGAEGTSLATVMESEKHWAWEPAYAEDRDDPVITPSGIMIESLASQIPTKGILYPQNFGLRDLVKKITVLNSPEEQLEYLKQNEYPKSLNLHALLKNRPTDLKIELADLRTLAPLEHEILLNLPSPWSAPKQIDLMAS